MSAVEFALAMPLLLMLLTTLVELGNMFMQATAIEKGLRAGAIYAARNTQPLSAAVTATTNNLVKYGNLAGAGNYLATGWSQAGASLSIASANYVLEDTPIPVLTLTAAVPYVPIMTGLYTHFGLTAPTITLTHQQPYVGD